MIQFVSSQWRSWALRFIFLALVGLCTQTAQALELSIHPNSSDTLTAVLAEGRVEPGDTQRLEDFLLRQPERRRTAVYLASGGGSLYEGMSIGRFFTRNGIQTVVEGGRDCASACALAFLGGHDRSGRPWRSSSDDSRLGFHAFSGLSPDLNTPDETQRIVADVLRYGRHVRAPLEIMIVNFSTPSHSIYWLSGTEICALGIKLWSNTSRRFIC